MKELKIFNYENQEVRTIEKDGQTWWVLKDICNVLKIKNPSDIVNRLDSDEVTRFNLGGLSGITNIVNESGLYNVILRSDKPQAKPFRKWVTSEVLPQIRQTGQYSIQKQLPQNYIQALESLVASEKEKERLRIENEYLEKTKAWINDKKTATAMNTASQKSKEVRRLKIELDRSKEYASIKAVEKATGGRFKWQPIRNYCTSQELEMKKVFDPNFGAVNTYPAEAWEEVYGIDLEMLFD